METTSMTSGLLGKKENPNLCSRELTANPKALGRSRVFLKTRTILLVTLHLGRVPFFLGQFCITNKEVLDVFR